MTKSLKIYVGREEKNITEEDVRLAQLFINDIRKQYPHAFNIEIIDGILSFFINHCMCTTIDYEIPIEGEEKYACLKD